jgi:hypothetical protein
MDRCHYFRNRVQQGEFLNPNISTNCQDRRFKMVLKAELLRLDIREMLDVADVRRRSRLIRPSHGRWVPCAVKDRRRGFVRPIQAKH